MEYFEIFLSRMVMCRKSAELLGYRFALNVNGLVFGVYGQRRGDSTHKSLTIRRLRQEPYDRLRAERRPQRAERARLDHALDASVTRVAARREGFARDLGLVTRLLSWSHLWHYRSRVGLNTVRKWPDKREPFFHAAYRLGHSRKRSDEFPFRIPAIKKIPRLRFVSGGDVLDRAKTGREIGVACRAFAVRMSSLKKCKRAARSRVRTRPQD